MNTPSPFIPRGATPPGGKSSLYQWVLIIVTIHVVFIGGLLLQGCKDTSTKDSVNQGGTSPTADMTAPSNTTPAEVPVAVNPYMSNSYVGTPAPAPVAQPMAQPVTGALPQAAPADIVSQPAPISVETKEYVIAKGDTLGAIARKNGLSLKALMEANPGVNAKKLRIGQKVQIPAGASAVASASAPGATPDAAPADGGVYVVKSGDTLTKIARAHSTSFKKIMALNDLKTTAIHVGQKLKLPAARTTISEPAAAPAAVSIAPAAPAAVPALKISAASVPVSPVASN